VPKEKNTQERPQMHYTQDIITLFNLCFESSHNTQLIRGGDEPIYVPASKTCSYHQVVFAHNFYSSALHEIAHWLVAGPKRRQQLDYGYWYLPDGRNEQQQRAFEQVEVKPQAIEWILSAASGHSFQPSVDNLGGAEPSVEQRQAFVRDIHAQVLTFFDAPFPDRMQSMVQALLAYYRPGQEIAESDCVSCLRLL
jgi:elongation factor P hydroxylase